MDSPVKSLIPTLKRNSACKTQEDHLKIRLALSVIENKKSHFIWIIPQLRDKTAFYLESPRENEFNKEKLG